MKFTFVRLPGFTQVFFISVVERLLTAAGVPVNRDAQALNEASREHGEFSRRVNDDIKRSYRPTPAGAQFPSLRAQDKQPNLASTGWDPNTERFVTFGFLKLTPYVQRAFLARGQERSYSFLKGAA